MKLPKVIPPGSVVRLVKADASVPAWRARVGEEYRVGYYRRTDGLDSIWLVNAKGEYQASTDRIRLARYFAVTSLSREKDVFGESRPPLQRLQQKELTSKDFPPPLSLLRLKRKVSLEALTLIEDQVGQYFRVGYYTPNDGLEIVWIVDEKGEYIGTIGRSHLNKYFDLVKLSKEVNYCDTRRIRALPYSKQREAARMRKILRDI